MARSTADVTESRPETIDFSTLDDRIATILLAIEQEKTPENLLGLAKELQEQLLLHRQRLAPN